MTDTTLYNLESRKLYYTEYDVKTSDESTLFWLVMELVSTKNLMGEPIK